MGSFRGRAAVKRQSERSARAKVRKIATAARTSDRAKLLKQADGLCRAIVFQRDGGCVRCQDGFYGSGGGGTLQWAHVYSRSKGLSLRLDPDGSMVLCAGHHYGWWHQCPTEAARWWHAKYPERARRLELIRLTKRRPDLKLMVLDLKSRQMAGA